ncbi:MAG TPA: ABC transporter permease subunit [Candidatus Micrarchaeaceae archaeon]|nr:ABC transporter permease subunit [Candidatus Micrarchaeaceae archaeon]
MIRARRRKLQIFRAVVLILLGAFFLVPIGSMFEFSTRGNTMDAPRTLAYWASIFTFPDLVQAMIASLELAAITALAMLLLLVPTMIWIRLRLPRLRRVMEFICLLPLTIPAIVLVVGLFPIYLWVSFYGDAIYPGAGDSILTLAFTYVILVLPYTYRTLDAGLSAIDVKTLSEAARSLGAGWPTVILRVIVPNMPAAILNSCLLAVALVLGEYTVANLLNFENLQVALVTLGRLNAGVSIAVAVAGLMFTFGLLVALSFVGRTRSQVKPAAPKAKADVPRVSASSGPVWGQRT